MDESEINISYLNADLIRIIADFLPHRTDLLAFDEVNTAIHQSLNSDYWRSRTAGLLQISILLPEELSTGNQLSIISPRQLHL